MQDMLLWLGLASQCPLPQVLAHVQLCMPRVILHVLHSYSRFSGQKDHKIASCFFQFSDEALMF